MNHFAADGTLHRRRRGNVGAAYGIALELADLLRLGRRGAAGSRRTQESADHLGENSYDRAQEAD